jgi:hypothetical protein
MKLEFDGSIYNNIQCVFFYKNMILHTNLKLYAVTIWNRKWVGKDKGDFKHYNVKFDTTCI